MKYRFLKIGDRKSPFGKELLAFGFWLSAISFRVSHRSGEPLVNRTSALRYLLLILPLLGGFRGAAQSTDNYPVQVTPIIKPPYSLYWNEYTTKTDFLKVNLLLKDLSKTNTTVYLNIKLSMVGVEISNPVGYIPNTRFTLTPGNILQLTGADLAENLSPQNLIVNGIDPAVLTTGGKLPEGLYTFTVTAYEIDRNRQVSNIGQALMSIYLGLPPIITYPADGQVIKAPISGVFQPILFNWVPRNNASLNGFNTTNYEVTLIELTDDQDPNVAMDANQIQRYTTTVGQTSILYGSANFPGPNLEVGKRYALRVRAIDQEGRDVYENGGKSQVVAFEYGGSCDPPQITNLKWLDYGSTIVLNWEPVSNAIQYELLYRGSNFAKDSTVSTGATGIVLPKLDPEQTYSFSLASVCELNRKSGSVSTALGGKYDGSGGGDYFAETGTTAGRGTGTDANALAKERATLEASVLDPFKNPVSIDGSGTPIKGKTVEEMLAQLESDLKDPTKIPKCNAETIGDVDCKIEQTAPTVAGDLLPSLAPGDFIVVNYYNVLVTKATGGGGSFTGEGLLVWPFLSNAKVPVTFAGITVLKPMNTTTGGCVSDGNVVVKGSDAGVLDRDATALLQGLYDKMSDPNSYQGPFENALDRLKTIANKIKNNPSAATDADWAEYKKMALASAAGTADYVKKIEAFYQPPTQQVQNLINDLKALATSLTADATCAASKNCTNFDNAITAKDKIMAAKTLLNDLAVVPEIDQVITLNGKVVFDDPKEPSPKAFGFDAFTEKYTAYKYDYIQATADYIVPYRSLKAGEAGTVKAKLITTDGKLKPEKVTFKTKDGTPLTAVQTGTEWTISLPSGAEGADGATDRNIYAIYDDGTIKNTIGKLVVERYTPKPYNVKLIAINGAAVPANAQSELNKIYEPAQINFTVTTDAFTFDLVDGALSVGDNATLSSYTTEMNALKAAYFAAKPRENDMFYIFVVPQFDKPLVAGYMPRGKNIGFVALADGQVIAHELGHGLFGLEHTFDAIPKSSTDNLMDYANGRLLVHKQWKQIRNPGLIINWFDDEEDAMAKGLCPTCICIDGTAFKGKIFKTAVNQTISLRPDEEPVAFNKEGQMYSFKSNGEIFVPWNGNNGKFYCYAPIAINPKPQTNSDLDKVKYSAVLGTTPETVSVDISTQKVSIGGVEVFGDKCLDSGEPSNDYISKGKVKNRSKSTNFTPQHLDQLSKTLEKLNASLQALLPNAEFSTTVVDASDSKAIAEMMAEATKKGLILQEQYTKIAFQDVLVCTFLKRDGPMPSCEANYVSSKMTALQTSTPYGILNPFQKVLVSTSYYAYQAVFAVLLCSTDASKFPNQVGIADCSRAFAAGALHSIIEDFEVLGMISGIIDMAGQAAVGGVHAYLDYPKNLKGFYDKVKSGATLEPVDFVKILPPPNNAIAETGINIATFFYKNYFKDADCWKSGELAAMVVPAVFTGGAYLLEKGPVIVGKLAGRAKKIFSTADDLTAFFKAGKKMEYFDADAGKFAAIENDLDEVTEVLEETSSGMRSVCSLCLLDQMSVYKTQSNLGNLSNRTSVKFLTDNQQIVESQDWVKVSSFSDNLTTIKVLDEALSLSALHQILTKEGWKLAQNVGVNDQIWSIEANNWLSVSGVQTYTLVEPQKVEGLYLPNAQGYAVGKYGIFVAASRKCIRKKGYKEVNKWIRDSPEVTNLGADADKFIDYLNGNPEELAKATSQQKLDELAKSWGQKSKKSIYTSIKNMVDDLTSDLSRSKISDNIRETTDSKAVAQAYFDAKLPTGYTGFDDWYNNYFLKEKKAFQGHHIFPIGVLKNNPDLQKILKWADDNGRLGEFKYNDLDNGMMVQTKAGGFDATGHANHPEYDKEINRVISNELFQGNTNSQLEKAFDDLLVRTAEIKTKIKTEVIEGTKDINDLKL